MSFLRVRGPQFNKRKVNAKHKIQFDNEESNRYHHLHTFGAVRVQVLQKLLFLNSCLVRTESPMYRILYKRYCEVKDKPFNGNKIERIMPRELVNYLEIKDIQMLFNCSERTAFDYRETLYDILYYSSRSSFVTK
jgi:hypothetical protein